MPSCRYTRFSAFFYESFQRSFADIVFTLRHGNKIAKPKKLSEIKSKNWIFFRVAFHAALHKLTNWISVFTSPDKTASEKTHVGYAELTVVKRSRLARYAQSQRLIRDGGLSKSTCPKPNSRLDACHRGSFPVYSAGQWRR